MNEGIEAWKIAFGALTTFLGVRAAFHAIRQAEGTAPESEQTILLRKIEKRLAQQFPLPDDESIGELEYYDIL